MKKSLAILGLLGLFLILGCSKNKAQDKQDSKGGITTSNSQTTETENVETTTEIAVDNGETTEEAETIIIRDENFDFNANFEEALKSSGENTKADASGSEKEELVPPDPVSNLLGKFDWKKNLITLTWDEPENPEFTHVEIRNNNSKDVVIVPKNKKTYSFTPKGKDAHKYIVTTCDSRGLKGKNAVCSVEEAYLFTSMSVPVVANTGYGKTVEIEIKGINFDKYGILEKDFRIFCPSNSYVTNKSKITVVNRETLSATLTIPKKSGNFAIIVSCGDVKLTDYFTVENYSSYTLGKIMYKGNEPEAIIAGFDSHGYPFGMALKEQGGLKWATEGSFGYNNCFMEIVSEPDVVGVNSAINAKFSGDIDGVDNWDLICSKDEKCRDSNGNIDMSYVKRNYPAFYYGLNYGKDWFVPSVSELCQIYKNKELLNNIISQIGGKRLKDEFYWSSSQNDYSSYNACAVKFVNGAIYKYYKKGNAISVRCIKMYK